MKIFINITMLLLLVQSVALASEKKEDWQELAQFLAEKGLAVLVPDLKKNRRKIDAFWLEE